MQLKSSMNQTLEKADYSIKAKYDVMEHTFLINGLLISNNTFIGNILGDTTTKEKMPLDGTVFQLSSNVMTFLQKCTDEFIDVLAKILSQDAAYTQRLLDSPVEISSDQQNFALVGLYAKKILVQLNLTLISKSDFYADECLKAVFR